MVDFAKKLREQRGEEEPEPLTGALPVVDKMPVDDARTASELMQEGIELQEQIEIAGARLDEIKTELLQIQVAHDMLGFRYGDIFFIGSYAKGRKTLNKELLLENGVEPEIIQKSYKEGEASWRRTLKRAKK